MMKIVQISVFLENRKGRLYEATKLLGDAGIDIKALTIAENGDFGVLRLIVEKSDEALALLTKHNFVATFTDIVAVAGEDKPGGLAKVLAIFNANDINVEYMYVFYEKTTAKGMLIFRFSDPDRALEVLAKNNIPVVSKKQIQSL